MNAEESPAVLTIALPAELAEAIAERAAEIVFEKLRGATHQRELVASPYLTVAAAADYLGCRSRQRVDDLLSSRRLTRYKDGRRTLIARAELDAYLAGRRGDSLLTPAPQNGSSKPFAGPRRSTSSARIGA